MQCPSCQRENPSDARFCNGCGQALAQSCASCGRENPPDAAFCAGCGSRLGGDDPPGPASDEQVPAERDPRAYTPQHLADRILRTRSALEGERKHVAVLFCDLVDSTPLAERLGAEDMHGVMDRCFAIILDHVHRYEGTVNQFLGDGVMALFGAPLALEDAPRRAVTAALAVQRELDRFSDELQRERGVEFRMRIGIHSGPVVVGRIGDDLRMDYTAVGDTTNLAARLQGLAPPGGVLISEDTESLVEGWFELEDAGLLDVKGKTEPVHAFRVLGERGGVLGRVEARAQSGLTPLVGREHELAALERAFDQASHGQGQAVFLVGEAGIGKSRLRYEFQKRLEGRPHAWLEGRCMAYARDFPFHPLVDAIRREVGLEEGDDDEAALQKLAEHEASEGGDLDWTLPFIRLLLSLPSGDEQVDALDAATRRSETFRAICARFKRRSEVRPLVLVIEDIHWIDRASEDFLRYMIDSLPGGRCLLILTHRPGYEQPFGDRSYHLRLALQPLSEIETGHMAEKVLEASDVPTKLRRIVASRAEGNPFFVEEVLQSLVEDGLLRVCEGRAEVAADLDDLDVPESIHDILMARLDRLPDEPKRALQVGAVIGREFALRLLGRIVEAGDRLGPMIDELRAVELIYEKAAHPELAYMFKHALTRDVAYESVLESRRRALHRGVGRAIEELYADRLAEHVEQLAHHFGAAEEWEKAFAYRVQAAKKAAEAFANEAAVEHVRIALEIADQMGEAVGLETRRELEELRGNAAASMSDFVTSGGAFLRAAELAADPVHQALNHGRAAHSFFWGHDYPQLVQAIEECSRISQEHGIRDGKAMAASMRAFYHAILGEWKEELQQISDALEIDPVHPEVAIVMRYVQGESAEWSGHYERALQLQTHAIEIARAHSMPGLSLPAHWFRAKALCCLGRYGEALAAMNEGFEVAARIGDRHQTCRMLNTIGWMHAEIGAHERASEYNQRSIDEASKMLDLGFVMGIPEIHSNACINLAHNWLALGHPDTADEALGPVREDLQTDGDPWMRWRYSLHLADVEARLALTRGRHEAALETVEGELRGGRQRRAPKIVARALELRGRILLCMDRREEAEQSLREAHAEAEAVGYPPAGWRALALLGEAAERNGDEAEARRLRESARERIRTRAESIPDPVLVGGLRRMADRIADDPLASCS